MNVAVSITVSPAQIELCACKTGTGKFAQQLADLTGVPVQGPRGDINVLSGPLNEVGGVAGVAQVRDPITGLLRAPGELVQTFTPKPSLQVLRQFQ